MTLPAPLCLAYEILPLVADLQWAIGGSVLLHRLGLNATPQDLDIVSTLEDFANIRTRLASVLGNPSVTPHASYASIGFARFHAAAGIGLDLIAGVRVRTPAGQLVDWHFDAQTIDYADGLPWMRAVDWRELYALFGRPEQVRALDTYLAAKKTQ